MSDAIPGLHHVTAISGDPQRNVDYYTGVLRQHLVKRTVNFDDPGTYHLYYGDKVGSPGTILTFFPFVNAGPGRAGPGMASAVAYGVPEGGLDAWMAHLADAAIDFDGPTERFGAPMITLVDPDGMVLELIETTGEHADPHPGPADDGFHSVTLWLDDPGPTARLLTEVMGYREAGHEHANGTERLRLRSPGGGRASMIDLKRSDDRSIGRQGAGSIHHVAFRAISDDVQREWRDRVGGFGLDVTPVIDRQYFNAIYFREPGGVLFEIATDPPGFAVDEDVAELGRHLKLPPRYEAHRAEIERVLPPLKVPA